MKVFLLAMIAISILVFALAFHDWANKDLVNQEIALDNNKEIIRLLQPDIAIDTTYCEEKKMPGYGKKKKVKE